MGWSRIGSGQVEEKESDSPSYRTSTAAGKLLPLAGSATSFHVMSWPLCSAARGSPPAPSPAAASGPAPPAPPPGAAPSGPASAPAFFLETLPRQRHE